MIAEILADATAFKNTIANLKAKSGYYPNVFVHNDGDVIYFSTLVRVLREGVWYKVHVAEYCIASLPSEKSLKRLHEAVYNTIHLYRLCGLEDIDESQIDEKDRLLWNINQRQIKA